MENVCNDKLYQEVAKELNLPENLVKEVVHAQSLFTHKTIKKGAFESIRYVYLGKIAAKLRKIQKLNDIMGKQ